MRSTLRSISSSSGSASGSPSRAGAACRSSATVIRPSLSLSNWDPGRVQPLPPKATPTSPTLPHAVLGRPTSHSPNPPSPAPGSLPEWTPQRGEPHPLQPLPGPGSHLCGALGLPRLRSPVCVPPGLGGRPMRTPSSRPRTARLAASPHTSRKAMRSSRTPSMCAVSSLSFGPISSTNSSKSTRPPTADPSRVSQRGLGPWEGQRAASPSWLSRIQERRNTQHPYPGGVGGRSPTLCWGHPQ